MSLVYDFCDKIVLKFLLCLKNILTRLAMLFSFSKSRAEKRFAIIIALIICLVGVAFAVVKAVPLFSTLTLTASDYNPAAKSVYQVFAGQRAAGVSLTTTGTDILQSISITPTFTGTAAANDYIVNIVYDANNNNNLDNGDEVWASNVTLDVASGVSKTITVTDVMDGGSPVEVTSSGTYNFIVFLSTTGSDHANADTVKIDVTSVGTDNNGESADVITGTVSGGTMTLTSTAPNISVTDTGSPAAKYVRNTDEFVVAQKINVINGAAIADSMESLTFTSDGTIIESDIDAAEEIYGAIYEAWLLMDDGDGVAESSDAVVSHQTDLFPVQNPTNIEIEFFNPIEILGNTTKSFWFVYKLNGGSTTGQTISHTTEGVSFTSGTFTLGASIDAETITIDSHTPEITAVSIPNAIMGIDDVVTTTITTVSDTDVYTLSSGTVAGYTLGSLNRVNATTYTATFTVTEGGSDIAAGATIPVANLVLVNPATHANEAFSTTITQNADAIDANRPASPTIDPITGDDIANAAEMLAGFTITGTKESGATVTTSGETATSTSLTTWSFTFPPEMLTGAPEGIAVLSADATDAAGNQNAASAERSVLIDTIAPTNQNTVFASSDTVAGGATVTIVSSGTASNAVWFAPSGTTVFTAGATKTTAGGTATSILAPATAGDYKLYVLDEAGNPSSASTATLTVAVSAPTFTASRTALNTIVLDFSENVDVTTTNGSGYAVDGAVVTANTDPAGSSDLITLTTTGLTSTSSTPTVTYTQAAGTTVNGSMTEVADNASATAADFVPPTFTARRSALNTIVLTFSENVTAADTATAAWTVADATVSAVTQPSSSTSLTITTTGLTSTFSTPAVTYVAASGTVRDVSAATNEVANSSTANAADAVRPTVVSAAITDVNEITVVYSEAVTSTDADYSSLVLTAGGARSVTAVSGSGTTTIVLTFNGAAAATGETATMNIASTVEDVSAVTNALSAVTGQAVTDGQAPPDPTFSPIAGTFTATQSVTITSSGSDSIRYTDDGTTPSCSTGTLYSGAVSVSSTKTLKAIACSATDVPSSVVSALFTINSVVSGGGGSGGGPVVLPSITSAPITTPPVSTPPVSVPVDTVPVLVGIQDPSQTQALLTRFSLQEQPKDVERFRVLIASDAKQFRITLTDDQLKSITNFVTYGASQETIKLGSGERRAVIRDYFESVGRSEVVWEDIQRMTTGQKVVQRNLTNEQAQVNRVLINFRRITGKQTPNFKNPSEDLAWNTMMYRIRFPRNLVLEKQGIIKFESLFDRSPSTPMEWSIVRALGYALK